MFQKYACKLSLKIICKGAFNFFNEAQLLFMLDGTAVVLSEELVLSAPTNKEKYLKNKSRFFLSNICYGLMLKISPVLGTKK